MINIKRSILKDIEHDIHIINGKISLTNDNITLVFLSGKLEVLQELYKNISTEY